jgi:hypothetical protein
MKKLILLFFAIAAMAVVISSCNDDDDGGTPGNPTISADKTSLSGSEGETEEININWTASAGVKFITVNSDNATVPATAEGTTGSFKSTVTYTESDETITYTITDIYNKTSTVSIDVVVSMVIIKDADLVGGEDYNWTSDKIYLLDGLVYLEEVGKLYIDPGTIVKFKSQPSTGDNTSALIITRDAQIFAEGTAEEPIIFTSDLDDGNPGSLDDKDNSLWGGLILLGKSRVSIDGSPEGQIEGIDATEPRGRYGGTNNEDNSGVLRYVSIRHTGAELAPGDELQGLTLGAVGSGTTIEYVEIFASSDDGIEFFGGHVSLYHIVVAWAEDDSFDWDIGWRGAAQFWFAVQRDDVANHGGEWDGAIPDGTEDPYYSMPTLYNATFIGSGVGAENAKNSPAIIMRDATAGTVANSIIVDFTDKGIEVEDLAPEKGIDSYKRMQDGELKLLNNMWWVGGNTTIDISATGILQPTVDDNNDPVGDDPDCSDLATHMTVNLNTADVDPEIAGIGRTIGSKSLDPRPTSAAAKSDLADVPEGLESVGYKGAFDPDAALWIKGWTALDEKGYLVD